MKIAILLQHVSFGGGIRFFKSLVGALAEKYADLNISIFVDAHFIKEEEKNSFFSKHSNIRLVSYKEKNLSFYFLRKILGLNFIGSILSKIIKRLGIGVSPVFSENTIDEINKHDLLYLPWPFYLKPWDIKIPVFGTFHDFNYMHPSFGNFGKLIAKILHKETAFWLNKSPCPVVSSEFIKSELDKFYPFASNKTKVVHVSTFIYNEKESLDYLTKSFKTDGLPPSMFCIRLIQLIIKIMLDYLMLLEF